MDIVDIVTLISSTVLSRSHVEVSASVSVKNPTSPKNMLGNGTLILTIPLIITIYPSFHGCLHTIRFVFGYQIKWCSWKLNRLQLFHATLKTVWNFYYIVFKSSPVVCSNVLSAPNKPTLGCISFVSSEVSCSHQFYLPQIPWVLSLIQCKFSFLPYIYCSLHLNEWKCLIAISQYIWMLVSKC